MILVAFVVDFYEGSWQIEIRRSKCITPLSSMVYLIPELCVDP